MAFFMGFSHFTLEEPFAKSLRSLGIPENNFHIYNSGNIGSDQRAVDIPTIIVEIGLHQGFSMGVPAQINHFSLNPF